MIKKLISFCVILSICVLRVSALNDRSLSAECAVVLNVQTGEVLFSKNADMRHSMASTTKIMTALLAVESGKLQSEIVVSDDMLKVEGTSMGLVDGDSVSLNELVYGMMLSSGNDTANVTAFFLGDSIENFASMMNNRATEIGMKNTSFVTPSGLDADEHFSTAYDMALLGAAAVKNPKFVSVCSSESVSVTFGNPPYRRKLYNHNKLLNLYDGALGIKTGFTKKSGRCLVSYAKKDSAELVAVTLNAPDDWNDHIKMLDYGFLRLKECVVRPALPSKISVVGGVENSVSINVKPFVYSYLDSQNSYYRLFLDKFVYAPITSGTVVGYCEYYLNGAVVETQPIVVNESVQRM
ncbi:MAG: D-alanyl-D-alanine carboxypeptidase [Clostridia bacterium]|nr:D-alanyl-D-alanine carboxypeptidase [Clostridia bacterium]